MRSALVVMLYAATLVAELFDAWDVGVAPTCLAIDHAKAVLPLGSYNCAVIRLVNFPIVICSKLIALVDAYSFVVQQRSSRVQSVGVGRGGRRDWAPALRGRRSRSRGG